MSLSTFNFHDLARFQLQTEADYARDFFQAEYGWAAGTGDAPYEIQLDWRHSSFPILQGNRGTFHSHKLAARWRYQIELDEGTIAIRAAGNRLGLTMVHHMLIHPSLRYLVSQQGVILLHGAALADGGSSYIFTGLGGTGKTTTTSLLLDRGSPAWQLHADDFVFLNDEGKSFCYLTRAHLYQELLGWVPALKPRLTPVERTKAFLFNLILSLSRKHIRWAVRLPLMRLWPNRSTKDQAKLAGLMLLERSDTGSVEIVAVQDKNRLIGDLISMNMFEARHFVKLLEKALGTEKAANLVADWKDREQSVLESALTHSTANRLRLPRFVKGDAQAAALIESKLAGTIGKSERP